jgi:hypothetical protein
MFLFLGWWRRLVGWRPVGASRLTTRDDSPSPHLTTQCNVLSRCTLYEQSVRKRSSCLPALACKNEPLHFDRDALIGLHHKLDCQDQKV